MIAQTHSCKWGYILNIVTTSRGPTTAYDSLRWLQVKGAKARTYATCIIGAAPPVLHQIRKLLHRCRDTKYFTKSHEARACEIPHPQRQNAPWLARPVAVTTLPLPLCRDFIP